MQRFLQTSTRSFLTYFAGFDIIAYIGIHPLPLIPPRYMIVGGVPSFVPNLVVQLPNRFSPLLQCSQHSPRWLIASPPFVEVSISNKKSAGLLPELLIL